MGAERLQVKCRVHVESHATSSTGGSGEDQYIPKRNIFGEINIIYHFKVRTLNILENYF